MTGIRERWYCVYERAYARTGFGWHGMAGHVCDCRDDSHARISLICYFANEVAQ